MPKKSPKKKRPSRHSVTAALDNWELAKRESAVTFQVRKKGDMLGTLSVGRGSIAWTPANGKKPYLFSWRHFAERIHRLDGRE
jgi:hypothetical protein